MSSTIGMGHKRRVVAGAVIALNVRGDGIYARQLEPHTGADAVSLAADNSAGLQLDERLAAAVGIMRIRALRAGTQVSRVLISSSPEIQGLLALDELRTEDEAVLWVDAAVAQLAALRGTHNAMDAGTSLHLELTMDEATLRAVDSGSAQSRMVARTSLTNENPAEAVSKLFDQFDGQAGGLVAVIGNVTPGASIAESVRRKTSATVVHATNGIELALDGSLAAAPSVEQTRTRPRHAAPPTTGRPSILRRIQQEKRSGRGTRRRRI